MSEPEQTAGQIAAPEERWQVIWNYEYPAFRKDDQQIGIHAAADLLYALEAERDAFRRKADRLLLHIHILQHPGSFEGCEYCPSLLDYLEGSGIDGTPIDAAQQAGPT